MFVVTPHLELQLLSAADLAKLLGTSTRTIWRLLSQGKLPKPLRLGTRPRWPANDVERWIKAGMPDADAWSDEQ